MPKLLSRSKHEEFESKSALQIKDHKKMEHYKNAFPVSTVHLASTVHPPATVHLLFDASDFCYKFWSFDIIPCNSFWFWFLL